mmetsp:Transcript_61516/g.140876  ORF Transcript_61516/g.140876 Transcript_61516/m.140876 type:complete len:425 (-) Transcript_61516:25-1299(-)
MNDTFGTGNIHADSEASDMVKVFDECRWTVRFLSVLEFLCGWKAPPLPGGHALQVILCAMVWVGLPLFKSIENFWYIESTPIWHDLLNLSLFALGACGLASARRRAMQTSCLEILRSLEIYGRESIARNALEHTDGTPRRSLVLFPRIAILLGIVVFGGQLVRFTENGDEFTQWAFQGTSNSVNARALDFSFSARILLLINSKLAHLALTLAYLQLLGPVTLYFGRWVNALECACETWSMRCEAAILSRVGCRLTDALEDEHEALSRPMQFCNDAWSAAVGLSTLAIVPLLLLVAADSSGLSTAEYRAADDNSASSNYEMSTVAPAIQPVVVVLLLVFFVVLFWLAGISDAYRDASEKLETLRVRMALARALSEHECKIVLDVISNRREIHGFKIFHLVVSRRSVIVLMAILLFAVLLAVSPIL